MYLRGAPRGAAIPYGLADLLGQRDGCSDVVLVEGVLDVHTLRAHGIQSVAALGGTATNRSLFEALTDEGVFLAMDSGPAKKLIIEHLQGQKVPFVDVGMGIYQKGDSLAGIIRTTTGVPGHDSEAVRELSFADEEDEDEYDQNIQIADLNMLNAAFAVIRWKKLLGFYLDHENETSSLYTVDGNHLVNEEWAS